MGLNLYERGLFFLFHDSEFDPHGSELYLILPTILLHIESHELRKLRVRKCSSGRITLLGVSCSHVREQKHQ